jgi:hypothetical protein
MITPHECVDVGYGNMVLPLLLSIDKILGICNFNKEA